MGEKYYSKSAVELLVGTALVESGLRHLKQIGGGPALGLFQMEPATHDDHCNHMPEALADAIEGLSGIWPGDGAHRHLTTNMLYACAMARFHYWRRPGALPRHTDVEGLANYWKKHYNTHMGAGEPDHFIDAYLRHAGGM